MLILQSVLSILGVLLLVVFVNLHLENASDSLLFLDLLLLLILKLLVEDCVVAFVCVDLLLGALGEG